MLVWTNTVKLQSEVQIFTIIESYSESYLIRKSGCLIHSNRDQSYWPNLKCVYLNVHALIGKPIWEKLFFSCLGLEFLDMTPGDGMTDAAIREVSFNQGCQVQKRSNLAISSFKEGQILKC
jgi:hypothetical protein